MALYPSSISRKCIFVGYQQGENGWKLHDLDFGNYFVSRELFEDNEDYTLHLNFLVSYSPVAIVDSTNTRKPMLGFDELNMIESPPSVDSSVVMAEPNDGLPNVNTSSLRCSNNGTSLGHSSNLREKAVATPTLSIDIAHGKGKRTKLPSTKLKGYVTYTIITVLPSSPSLFIPNKSSSKCYPLAHFINCEKFSIGYRNFLAEISAIPEKYKLWRNMELRARRIYPRERNPSGVDECIKSSITSVERLKARLVVFGNHQVEGIDCTDIFAPVAKMTIICTFLALATAKN